GEKVFYGVGIASDIRSTSLRRSAADDRALANLATQIEATVKRLSKDFQEITGRSTAAGKDSTERENVAQAFKVLVNQTLSGSKIIDHWEHPAKNEFYSLARIELKTIEKKIDSHNELSDESRDTIKKKAQKLYEEMAKEGL
nr:LPP20 family lipoprotein [Nitrospinaceae bacterium]